MRRLLIFALFTSAGCQQYAGVQMELIAQARRGIVMTSKSISEKSQLIQHDQSLRRKLLDEAFDADVREKFPLSSGWVIEHRKAYAAALDAFAQQQTAARDATLADQRNIAAIDEALARLAWLKSLELKWSHLVEDPKEPAHVAR